MRAWKKIKGRPPIGAIVAAIAAQRESDQWTRDNGQYIPNPATWLNQGRWEDEVIDPAEIETPQQRTARERAEALAAWAAEPELPGRRA